MTYPTLLDGIGKKFGTDKASGAHNYLPFYEERLSHLRDEKFIMFEIGVFKGESLKMWGEYFRNATIVGLDITPEAKEYEGGNCHVHIGDASLLETIDEVVDKYGAPLVVLDDGSHLWHHQIETLRYFWPKICRGGQFIMEDLHTSFDGIVGENPYYKGHSSISCYDFLVELNKHVVGRGYMGQEVPTDGFISNYSSTIRSVEWYPSTCILRKLA